MKKRTEIEEVYETALQSANLTASLLSDLFDMTGDGNVKFALEKLDNAIDEIRDAGKSLGVKK